MSANKPVSAQKLGSDLKRVDAHIIQAEEYEDLPELMNEMLARAKINDGGRPMLPKTRNLISLHCRAKLLLGGAPLGQAGKPAWQNAWRRYRRESWIRAGYAPTGWTSPFSRPKPHHPNANSVPVD